LYRLYSIQRIVVRQLRTMAFKEVPLPELNITGYDKT